MNKIKLVAIFLTAITTLLPLFGAAPKFSIKVTPVKTVYKPGEKIEFDIEVTHPENYQFRAWQATISKIGSPAGFEKKWNKWGAINLPPVHWVKKAAALQNKIRVGFIPDKDFIPGDYNFGIVARLYPDGNTSKTPKLISGRLNISLEAPGKTVSDMKPELFRCDINNISNKVSKAENGEFVCITSAKAVNKSERGACFTVKTILTGADGKTAGENSQIVGVLGKNTIPVKFTTSAKASGKYRLDIELWSNESTPALMKKISSDVELK